jgi:hypothetical protein
LLVDGAIFLSKTILLTTDGHDTLITAQYPSPTYCNVALNINLFQEALSLSDNCMTTSE